MSRDVLDIVLDRLDKLDSKIDGIMTTMVRKEDCQGCKEIPVKKIAAVGTAIIGIIAAIGGIIKLIV